MLCFFFNSSLLKYHLAGIIIHCDQVDKEGIWESKGFKCLFPSSVDVVGIHIDWLNVKIQ